MQRRLKRYWKNVMTDKQTTEFVIECVDLLIDGNYISTFHDAQIVLWRKLFSQKKTMNPVETSANSLMTLSARKLCWM